MRELLAAGADPRVKLEDGATALHLAAWKGHDAVLRLVLEHAMDVDVRCALAGSPRWLSGCPGAETDALEPKYSRFKARVFGIAQDRISGFKSSILRA